MDVRKFHNDIKKNMLSTYIKKMPKSKVKVLDLGCGRGGDIHKWMDAGVYSVVGLDTDYQAVAEAKKRFQEAKTKRPRATAMDFICLDLLAHNTPTDLISELKRLYGSTNWFEFQLVSMHFSLQYFVDDDKELVRILKFISQRLAPGGYFYGTCPREDKIVDLLDGKDAYQSEILKINKTRDSAILFNVDLGANSYFETFGVSEEYLVNMPHFTKLCKSVGLELVRIQNFDELSPLKAGPGKEFSDLYCTWAFVKPKQVCFFPLLNQVVFSRLEISSNHVPMVSKPHEAQRIQNAIRSYLAKQGCPAGGLSVIDMCACVGCDTIHLSQTFKAVLSIEKDEPTFGKLVNNIREYKLKNVHSLNADCMQYLHLYNDPNTVLYFDPPWLRVDNRNITVNGEPIAQVVANILRQFKYKYVVLKLPRTYPIQADSMTIITNKIGLYFFAGEA